jgi:hypothetical protein
MHQGECLPMQRDTGCDATTAADTGVLVTVTGGVVTKAVATARGGAAEARGGAAAAATAATAATAAAGSAAPSKEGRRRLEISSWPGRRRGRQREKSGCRNVAIVAIVAIVSWWRCVGGEVGEKFPVGEVTVASARNSWRRGRRRRGRRRRREIPGGEVGGQVGGEVSAARSADRSASRLERKSLVAECRWPGRRRGVGENFLVARSARSASRSPRSVARSASRCRREISWWRCVGGEVGCQVGGEKNLAAELWLLWLLWLLRLEFPGSEVGEKFLVVRSAERSARMAPDLRLLRLLRLYWPPRGPSEVANVSKSPEAIGVFWRGARKCDTYGTLGHRRKTSSFYAKYEARVFTT